MKRFPFLLLLATTSAMTGGSDIPSERDWPCYHGAQRDNISEETNLLQSWPDGGPPLLWTATGIGHGFSSVAVTGGRIFTAGMVDKQTHVIALDLNGKILWKKPSGDSWQASENQPWAVPYSGSRGTPTVDEDTVYHLAELGSLTAFDVATGEVRWQRNLLKDFAAPRPKYGYSESVLIRENLLFCCPGSPKGYVVALDKNTGQTVWANTALTDPIGYSSLVAGTVEGVEQLVGLTAARVFAVRVDNGKLLWEFPFANRSSNNATDALIVNLESSHGGEVFISSGYGRGSVLLQPRRDEGDRFSVKEVWTTALLDNHHGGVVLPRTLTPMDRHLYGAGHQAKGWTCLNLATGEERWRSPGKGSLTCADGRLYCLDESGALSLIRATSEKCEVLGSFQMPKGSAGPYWAHPVVCGGRLYVRHSESLYAYSIARDR